jgi:hypothetical protein
LASEGISLVLDRVFWERFDNLLCRPLRCRMLRDIEMDHTPALVCQRDEDKQLRALEVWEQ